VVVSGFRLGEADKILTLITEGRGTLRAVAKGVRKTKSRFGGRLEPLTHVGVMVYPGRSLDVIAQVDTLNYYPVLRATHDRLGIGFALAEAALRASHEHEPAPRLYRLLTAGLAGLEALEPGTDVPPLYLTVFLLRLIELSGFGLAIDSCASCGTAALGDRFGVPEGGVLCVACSTPTSYRVSPTSLALLGQLSTGRVAETAVRAGDSRGGPEAAALVRRFVEYHLEIRLRAPAVAAQL
jgi:DNA repair protein RecO (recombination protein O)